MDPVCSGEQAIEEKCFDSERSFGDVWLLFRKQQANLKQRPAGLQVKMAQVQ